jgi:SnoaL-like domain
MNLYHSAFRQTNPQGLWLDQHPQTTFADDPLKELSRRWVRRLGSLEMTHGVRNAKLDEFQQLNIRFTEVAVINGATRSVVGLHETPIQPNVGLELQTTPPTNYTHWTGNDPKGDELDVLHSLNDSYVNAYREADAVWYNAHLAPEYVAVQSDGALHDRATALARFSLPSFATTMKSFPVGQVRIRRVSILGTEVAMIDAQNDYETKQGLKGISRYTDIWLLTEGRWLCVLAHITPNLLSNS